MKVGVSEHAARALYAVADGDVSQPTCLYVAVERLDRAIKFRCRLRCRQQSAWYITVQFAPSPPGQGF
jgi:hypothetical protein